MSEAPHPAKFTPSIIPIVDMLLGNARTVLDPFAGVGRIHELRPGRETYGIEIEPEWAEQSPHTYVGNTLNLREHLIINSLPRRFDAIATSPVYGNRMSDHHDAKDGSYRRTYRHLLGRELADDNSGRLQWGSAYRDFHIDAWTQTVAALRTGGRFVLNVSDHIRNHERQHVTAWHQTTLENLGLLEVAHLKIATTRFRYGENHNRRVPYESVILFIKEVSYADQS